MLLDLRAATFGALYLSLFALGERQNEGELLIAGRTAEFVLRHKYLLVGGLTFEALGKPFVAQGEQEGPAPSCGEGYYRSC